ncbi:hypothetical protein Tco_0904738 [Tanacetum coccineum]
MSLHGYSDEEFEPQDNVTLISKLDRGKNKTGFIDGSCKRSNVDEVLAKHVWEELKETYDKVDGYLHHKIHTLKQNGSTLADYYHSLNALWKQFDCLVELPRCTCHAAENFKKHNQLMKLMQFLMGLDDSYMTIRSSILSRDPLPDVRSAYATISSEESHRVVSNSMSGTSQSFRPNTVNNTKKRNGQNVKGGTNSNNSTTGSNGSSGFTDEQLSTLISVIKDNTMAGKNVQANMAAKIEKEIDVLETMNIELEHSVATLRKENETLKQHYKDLYDSIKITRSKTTEQTTSLLANNAELKAQIQEKVFAIAALKNDLRKLKGNKSTFAKPDHLIASSSSRKSSKNMSRFSSRHALGDGSKPNPRSNNQTSRSLPVSKSSRVTITAVPKADHSKSSSSFSDSKNFVCSTCHKCVFNANHDACITKLLKEVNSHAKIQSHKTTNGNKSVEQLRICKKPERTDPTRHRTVGLRWVPTGKIFTPSTTKVDSEPPNGSNADITNQYESAQTLDVSAEVHQAAETVTNSNELDLLFDPLFDEYFNGENQVVLKSSAVTTTDASNKRQQQPDSTLSTSTLATIVTADGNFDLWLVGISPYVPTRTGGIYPKTIHQLDNSSLSIEGVEVNEKGNMIVDIEDDIMDPVMQCTTLPSHSGFSSKKLVSLVSEITTLSLTSHSEIVDIE